MLWGPGAIINNRYATRAERLYGYRSDSLVYHVYRINQRDDFDIRARPRAALPVVGWLVPYGAFLWAGLRYDHFGFFFDGGLLGGPGLAVELPLLRLAGKGIIVYPYGGDARVVSATRERGPWHAYSDIPVGEEDSDERDVRERLALFGRWADVMLGCADLVEDLPRLDGVLLYPFDTTELASGVARGRRRHRHRRARAEPPPLQGHALPRGCDRAACSTEGLPVELVVVEGHDERRGARGVLARRHRRRPVPARRLRALRDRGDGARQAGDLPPRRPLPPVPPGVGRTARSSTPIPTRSTDELRKLVLDPERRRELGARGPAYVQRYHSLEAVGSGARRHSIAHLGALGRALGARLSVPSACRP